MFLSRGSGKIEFTPTEEDAHVIADCLNDLCSLFSRLSLIVTMNLQYFLREVSFFSGPALLGETDRDNFLNPWEAKEYGLVSTVIDDGKPRLIAEGTNKDLPLE
ncbi:hypothetical protein F2Q69_00046388 [Brassica cretica]|uniref:ATP-dependent Clp protease proteolytic subunit n=1 Tax=Brassica cretica TaxID=69181 RepID=A0A8S9Q1P7_BRACR|nr:hypothetical protein F2Q69_00046388 [Brassica cretica]